LPKMMSGEAWLFLLSVLINAVNLFLQVFFTIMYSDLEWCVIYILRLHSYPLLPLATKWAETRMAFFAGPGRLGWGWVFLGK
jgi:hypothetical protein